MNKNGEENAIQYKEEKKKSNKKTVLIIVLIVLIIYIGIPIIFITLFINALSSDSIWNADNTRIVEKYNELSDEKKQNKYEEIYKYEEKATEYLKEKYNREFEISLSYKGYKSKGIEIDGSYGECGHDDNIDEYVFEIKSELPYSSYITVWKSITTEEVEIKEVNGEEDNRDDTGYETHLKLYNTKISLEEQIKEIVKGKYEIIMHEEPESVIIKLNDLPENIHNKDGKEFEDMVDKLNNLEINVKYRVDKRDLDYYDVNVQIKRNNINMIISDYLTKNYNKKYSMSYFDNNYFGIKIDVDEKFYNEYIENINSWKYDEMFNDILNILDENNAESISIIFEFKDDVNVKISYDIDVEVNGRYMKLEEYIEEYGR